MKKILCLLLALILSLTLVACKNDTPQGNGENPGNQGNNNQTNPGKPVISSDKRTATWDFNIGLTDIITEQLEFNMFDTIDDVDSSIIAPGMQGHISVNMKNSSSGDVKHSLSLSLTNDAYIPFEFSIDAERWVDSTDKLEIDESTIVKNGTASFMLYWRWGFNSEDDNLSIEPMPVAPTATLKIDITLARVN